MLKKSLFFALVLAPALALADPKTTDEWYKEGETQYNLGNFDKAAEAFKQGFSLETVDAKKPAYLYNVAQAYRQGQKCKDAAFFYKRYLSLKDQDTVKPLKPEKRAEIEQRISELEECAKNQEKIAHAPPGDTIPPNGDQKTGQGDQKTGQGDQKTGQGDQKAGPKVGEGGEGEGGEGEGGEGEGEGEGNGVHAGAMISPTLVNARFDVGGAKVFAGGLAFPLRPSVALVAGYPVFKQPQLLVDAGIAFAYQPVPYKLDTGDSRTGSFVSFLANAGATYDVAPKISARGDVGIGFLSFGGISQMGNPFTENGAGTSGALTMFAVRIAASADYQLAPNLVATVTPFAFSISPAKAGLREDIGSISRIDFMLGVGYRM